MRKGDVIVQNDRATSITVVIAARTKQLVRTVGSGARYKRRCFFYALSPGGHED
jgi:hypothetical protein